MTDNHSQSNWDVPKAVGAGYAIGSTIAVLGGLWALLRVPDGRITDYSVIIQQTDWRNQAIWAGIFGLGYAYLTSYLVFRSVKETGLRSFKAGFLVFILVSIQTIGIRWIREYFGEQGLLAARSSFWLICFLYMAYKGIFNLV